MESSLKAGEVQLKRSGSSQPFSSSQCLTAAPKTKKKGMSEIQHGIHGSPAAPPSRDPLHQQHRQARAGPVTPQGCPAALHQCNPFHPWSASSQQAAAVPSLQELGSTCASGLHHTRRHHTELRRGISDSAGLRLEKPLVPGGDASVSSRHIWPQNTEAHSSKHPPADGLQCLLRSCLSLQGKVTPGGQHPCCGAGKPASETSPCRRVGWRRTPPCGFSTQHKTPFPGCGPSTTAQQRRHQQ